MTTGLAVLMKRMMVENENLTNALNGKEIKPIDPELMTDDEIKVYKETGKQDSLLTTGEFARYFSAKKSGNKKTIKEEPKNEVKEDKKEIVTPAVKNEEIKTEETEIKENKVEKQEDKPTQIEEVSSMKDAVKFVKTELEKINLEDKETKTEENNSNGNEEEEADKNLQKKLEVLKSKMSNIIKDIKNTKPTGILIKDYNNLTSSKKKEAIVNMLKTMVSTLAQEQTLDMTDVINFGTNITTLANQHNKREYYAMLKTLKESLSKMKSNKLIEGIISKIDNEMKNVVITNKIKFITSIKENKNELDIFEDNLEAIPSILDSIVSRLNNGEDFKNILKSLEKKNNSLKENNKETKVVDNNTDDDVSENSKEEETIFLSLDEVDELAKMIMK